MVAPRPQCLPFPILPCLPVHAPQQFKNRQRCRCKNFQAKAGAPWVATQGCPNTWAEPAQPASCWEGGGMKEGLPTESRHPTPGALRDLSALITPIPFPSISQAHVTQPPRSESQLWALATRVRENQAHGLPPSPEGHSGPGPRSQSRTAFLGPSSSASRVWWCCDLGLGRGALQLALGGQTGSAKSLRDSGCVRRSGLTAWGGARGSL